MLLAKALVAALAAAAAVMGEALQQQPAAAGQQQAGPGDDQQQPPAASPTCALDPLRACPLPPWPSTYNLSQSSIMYQPWCGAGGASEVGCSTFLNVSWWWTQPSKLDPGSTGPAHWGLLSIDRSESTHMWAGTTYGGATPGDPNTYKSQQAVLANCAWQKAHGWVDRCFVYQNTVNALYDYETIRAVRKKKKRLSFAPLSTKNNHFAKTGSDKHRDKLRKKNTACYAGDAEPGEARRQLGRPPQQKGWQVRKRSFVRHFTVLLLKLIISPRQARDKHRKS
jgi:hypothetical protein